MSNLKKTVHELLRELAAAEHSVEMAEMFRELADRIEREYLPRPRFEDGELVEDEDEIDVNGTRVKVKSYVVDYDGLTTFLDGKRTLGYDLEPGKTAKRWKHEVLDADGVPIKVGDVVYSQDGKSFTVQEIMVDYDNDERTVFCGEYRKGFKVWHIATELTKKQPDSLERIEADAMMQYGFYWGCADVLCLDCPAMVDGKKPWELYATDGSCEKAKTLDLLRRQRELLEMGQA